MFETELLSTEIDFWRRATRIYRLLKVRHEVIRERMGDTKNFGKTVKTCSHGMDT
jgi:hypothetical protein